MFAATQWPAKRFYFRLCVTALIWAGLTTPGYADGHESENARAASIAPVVMQFFDSSVFDEDLSDHLREGHAAVEVRALSPFSLNDIPERLDKWFAVIKDSGGSVGARELPPEGEAEARGIIGMVLDVLTALFSWYEEAQLYGPAENYDALLFYRKDTGVVEKIMFMER